MKKPTLLFVLTLLPMFASADDSGTCGENLTWTYEEATKTLTIAGEGPMYDYNYNNSLFNYYYTPWDYIKEDIQTVIIEDGVTYIGMDAFYGNSFTSVTIGKSVTTICDDAFSRCRNLTSITIPDSVTYIGRNIFYNCKSLTSAIIGNGLSQINEYAFYGCQNLTSLTIGYSVHNISYMAFGGCSNLSSITFHAKEIGPWFKNLMTSVKEVIIGEEVISIDSDAFTETNWYNNQGDGILYLDNWILGYKGKKPSGELKIPEGTRGIADTAFSGCSGLTTVTFPSGIISIGSDAFRDCSNLSSATVLCSPTYVDNIIFSGCNKLKEAVFDCDEVASVLRGVPSLEKLTLKEGITTIGNRAFTGCSSLTSITIPNSVKTIGYYAFANCSSLTSITIPNSVTTIGSGAFENCSDLPTITIPNSVTTIDKSTFQDCSSLTSITIPNSVTTIGNRAFTGCSSLTSITIPNSVTTIDNWALSSCSSLTTITIPNSVTTIGEYTFWYCSSLTSVTIGNSVSSIGNMAFKNCEGLTTIIIPNSVTSIGNGVFQNCGRLSSVTIGNSVNSIGEEAFDGCNNLMEVKSFIESPNHLNTNVFTENTYRLGTLYVPVGKEKVYSRFDGWRNFLNIVEIDTEGIKQARIEDMSISYCGNHLTIVGVAEGTPIIIYNTSGKQIGEAVASEGVTNVNTSLQSKDVVIVKIGDRTVKVVVR